MTKNTYSGWFLWPFKGVNRGLGPFKRGLGGLFLEISSGNSAKTTGKSPPNPPKNLPEAFPEYPEITNKPVRMFPHDLTGLTSSSRKYVTKPSSCLVLSACYS